MSKGQKPIKLGDIPKKDPYQAPKGYFESLSGRISEKIEAGDKAGKIRKLIPRINWKVLGYTSAASVTLLMALFLRFQNKIADKAPEDLLAGVSTADLIAYLEYSEIETYDILKVIDPQLWDQPLADTVYFFEPQLSEEDFDLLYKRYGVSPDLETL